MATIMAMSVMTMVAVTSGSTPYEASANSGAHLVPVKNSVNETDWKNSTVGTTMAMRMPIVVATDTRAATKSRTSITRSP